MTDELVEQTIQACFPGDTAPLEGLDADAFGVKLDTAGMVVLLPRQNNPRQNGLWVVWGGAWYRPSVEMLSAPIVRVDAPGSPLDGTRWRRLTDEDVGSPVSGGVYYAPIDPAAVDAATAPAPEPELEADPEPEP